MHAFNGILDEEKFEREQQLMSNLAGAEVNDSMIALKSLVM